MNTNNEPNKIYVPAKWMHVPGNLFDTEPTTGATEYIRKDALLEWAKEMKTANETYVDKDEPETTQWYKHGAYHICNELIDKLDSL